VYHHVIPGGSTSLTFASVGQAGKGFLCRRIQMRSITEILPELRQ
jgi:hypothetical protein